MNLFLNKESIYQYNTMKYKSTKNLEENSRKEPFTYAYNTDK